MGAHEFKICLDIFFKVLIFYIYLSDFPSNISWLTEKQPSCFISSLIFIFIYGKKSNHLRYHQPYVI